jgi:HPt (histidine-containing phosphotransfer) domain-containing protein
MDQKKNEQFGGRYCSLDYLLLNLEGNEAAARRLIRLFLEHYPNLVRKLDDAVRLSDPKALKQAVHDIRGNCVLFSAQACLDRAKEIEGLIQEHSSLGTAGHVDWDIALADLREALARMVAELSFYLGESGSSVSGSA